MLHVTYEAVETLEPGRLARVDEDRGRVHVFLDAKAPLGEVVRQLNIEVAQLLASATWFQLWRDEIVSCRTPGAPLRVVYRLHQEEPDAAVVRESRGIVRVDIDPAMTVEEFAAAMNIGIRQLLAGGQWFQLHSGEIIDNSPEPMSRV